MRCTDIARLISLYALIVPSSWCRLTREAKTPEKQVRVSAKLSRKSTAANPLQINLRPSGDPSAWDQTGAVATSSAWSRSGDMLNWRCSR